jgi:hypothetical protein
MWRMERNIERKERKKEYCLKKKEWKWEDEKDWKKKVWKLEDEKEWTEETV